MFKYAGVNPCAEEPLPPGGACLLGSLNLSEFVGSDKFIKIDELKEAINYSITNRFNKSIKAAENSRDT